MKIVKSAEMRELDRKTIEEHGIAGALLMERAGAGVAQAVANLASITGYVHPTIRLIAGKGNNGGDAFVAARLLHARGFAVELLLSCKAEQLQGDAAAHYQRAVEAGLQPRELPSPEAWAAAKTEGVSADIVVDGILGTGAKDAPREPAASAIRYINAFSAESLVVAIDVPSGVSADSGETAGEAVMADLTVTMGLPKAGLIEPCAYDHVGNLEVVDIGIPQQLLDTVEAQRALITRSDLLPLFVRRPRRAHKGSFGHGLLIGGSRRYPGAILMATQAAIRSGMGLVTVLVPRSLTTAVSTVAPEAIVLGVEENEAGSIGAGILPTWRQTLANFDAVLLGPGMTAHQDTRQIVLQTIRECSVPLVLDADALNVLEGQPFRVHRATCPVLITPHPGELSRLMGVEVATIEADRMFSAVKAASATDATVILKGAGTIVAKAGNLPHVNMTCNPGMASGGMGDVLAGLLLGLVAQGLTPFEAALSATYLHGRAGDNVRWRASQAGLTASAVAQELPYAFRDVTLR